MFTKEEGRELKDIKVEEVSFVKRPANEEEFLFFKQLEENSLVCPTCGYVDMNKAATVCIACEGDLTRRIWVKETSPMDEIKDLFKSLFGEDLTENEIEKADKLSAEAKSAIGSALSMVSKYKAEMPDELIGALKVLARYASGKTPYPKPYKKNEEGEEEDLSKAGRTLSKKTMNSISQVIKLLQEIVEPKMKKKADKEEDTENSKLKALLKTLTDKEKETEKSDQDALIKILTDYAKSLEKPPDKKVEKTEKEEETELQKLKKRMEVVEKQGGKKKSLKEEDKATEGKEKDGLLWKSFAPDEEK